MGDVSVSLGESRFGGLLEATEAAYLGLLGLHADSPYRHVWRIWNFVTAINEGDGDEERYRQLCLGRARAFAASPGGPAGHGYPAASAVGKTGAVRSLEVCWIAGREPGTAVENPRQVSAYHYPRRYGPAAPSFSRAMRAPGPLLFISGTASIVGHESLHHDDAGAQLRETLSNLDVLLQRAQAYAAYEAEIYRAGIPAIHKGQTEAAVSLGMSRRLTLKRIILPQALRIGMPPMTNDFIALFKDSSLVSVIAITELTKSYGMLAAASVDFFKLGIITALLYFGMSYPLSRYARKWEKKLTSHDRN